MAYEEWINSIKVLFKYPISTQKIVKKLNVSESAFQFIINRAVEEGIIEIVGKNCDWEDMYQTIEKEEQ